MFLSSENISLRALEPTDLDFLYALENDASIWEVSNSVAPYSRFVLQKYLENAAADIYETRQLRFVIEEQNNGAVGAVDLFDFEPQHLRAGVGISVLAGFRKNKYASAAMELLKNYAQNLLNLHQLYSSVPEDNFASLQLFRKAGFEECGLHKDWLKTASGWKNVIEFQLVFRS
ncbi:GNAT family N-acetyltransferase [Adhaeribacter terreus]|uniref:GNAT family N-acetyltransferase n=1 Tax=Adhaeribacter terreus TaxID=529703 RepID=A0ABW0E7P3_9BACT